MFAWGYKMKNSSITGLAAAAFFLLLGLPARRAAAEEKRWIGNVNLLLGAKTLEKDDWEPAEKQGEVGFELDFKRPDWPLSVALDLLGAAGEGTVYEPSFGNIKFESETSELCVGIRKIWDGSGSVRPFVGGGLALVKATGKATLFGLPLSDSGTGSGFWLDAGIYWTLSEAFNLGLEFRTSSGKATIFDQEIKAGGRHAGLLLGWHWGGSSKNKAGYREPVPGRTQANETPAAEAVSPGAESGALDLELKKLEVEKQKLELEKARFEFEKQKAAEQ